MTFKAQLIQERKAQVGVKVFEYTYPQVTQTVCYRCRHPLVIVPLEKKNMLQCVNWECSLDHQPQGYLRR